MFKLAIRNIFRHKVRTLLTLAAIMFGVIALCLSGGFIEDVFVQLREATIHSQLGHIQVNRAGFSEYGRRDPDAYLLADPLALRDRIAEIPGVESVMQRLQFSGLISNGTAEVPIIGEGIEADKESVLGTFLQINEGRNLKDDDLYGILVGQGIAGALGLKQGDFVNVTTNTLDGSLNTLEFEVTGVFQTFSKDYDDRAIRITLAAAQELLSTDQAHTLVLQLTRTADTDRIAASLQDGLRADTYEVLRWIDLAEFYRSTVALYKRQFAVLQLVILVMVLLGVANSINMAIFERTGEFGTQMAIGDPRPRLFWQIMLESALLGVLGSLLGVAAGAGLAWAVSAVGIPMPPPPNSNIGYTALIRIVPTVLIVAGFVGAVASVIAAILPARRSARLDIVDALRQNI